MADGWLRDLIREPLLHFLIVGTALFAYGSLYGGVGASERRIVIDEMQVSRLAGQWQQQWRRPPDAEELNGIIREYIKEEIYFREAIRLGLDADDPIIRRRLRTKMEFLATAQIENAPPTESELKRYYLANRARYAVDPAYSFDQRYFGDDKSEAERAVTIMNSGKSLPALLIPLPAAMEKASASDIDRQFGAGFADSLSASPAAKWHGPVRSGYGWHVVRIRATGAPKVPPFADIAQRVSNDWRADTKAQREAAAYRALLDGYDIRIAKR